MVKLRLARKGRKNRAIYSIVAANSTSPRDGKFISKIGTYNPQRDPKEVTVDANKALDFLLKGAQPTPTVKNLLSEKGILYKKHLLIGVIKGAITQQEADKKFDDWIKDTKKEPVEFNITVEKAPKYVRSTKVNKKKEVTESQNIKKPFKEKSESVNEKDTKTAKKKESSHKSTSARVEPSSKQNLEESKVPTPLEKEPKETQSKTEETFQDSSEVTKSQEQQNLEEKKISTPPKQALEETESTTEEESQTSSGMTKEEKGKDKN